jgi:hypothetical protein
MWTASIFCGTLIVDGVYKFIGARRKDFRDTPSYQARGHDSI